MIWYKDISCIIKLIKWTFSTKFKDASLPLAKFSEIIKMNNPFWSTSSKTYKELSLWFICFKSAVRVKCETYFPQIPFEQPSVFMFERHNLVVYKQERVYWGCWEIQIVQVKMRFLFNYREILFLHPKLLWSFSWHWIKGHSN